MTPKQKPRKQYGRSAANAAGASKRNAAPNKATASKKATAPKRPHANTEIDSDQSYGRGSAKRQKRGSKDSDDNDEDGKADSPDAYDLTVESQPESSSDEDEKSAPAKKKQKKAQATKTSRTPTADKYWQNLRDTFEGGDHQEVLQAYLNDNYPPVTLDMLNEYLPKKLSKSDYDQDWTVDEEKDLRSEWKNDPQRSALLAPTSFPSHALQLWKATTRFWHRTPRQIISRENDLVYDSYENYSVAIRNDDGVEQKMKIDEWSVQFCKVMTNLVFHPLWEEDFHLFVFALQYAVIVRKGEHQDWPLWNPTGDEFLAAFIEVIEEHKGLGKPIPELHQLARSRLTRHQLFKSTYSQFLLALEREGAKEKTNVRARSKIKGMQDRTRGQVFRPYAVGAPELNFVSRALYNTTTAMGHPAFGAFTAEAFGRNAIKAKGKFADKPDQDGFLEFYERELLDERRRNARENNERLRRGIPDSEPYSRYCRGENDAKMEDASGDESDEPPADRRDKPGRSAVPRLARGESGRPGSSDMPLRLSDSEKSDEDFDPSDEDGSYVSDNDDEPEVPGPANEPLTEQTRTDRREWPSTIRDSAAEEESQDDSRDKNDSRARGDSQDKGDSQNEDGPQNEDYPEDEDDPQDMETPSDCNTTLHNQILEEIRRAQRVPPSDVGRYYNLHSRMGAFQPVLGFTVPANNM